MHFIQVLKLSLASRIQSLVGQVERFSARWHHTKPSNDLIESGDRKQCLSAVESIRSRKMEFSEMEKTLEEIT